jgi:hypothetical protein
MINAKHSNHFFDFIDDAFHGFWFQSRKPEPFSAQVFERSA